MGVGVAASLDVQGQRPAIGLRIPRVGVSGVQRTLATPDGRAASARLDLAVGLGGEQRGAHMSRFEEAVDEAFAAGAAEADVLAARVAEALLAGQDAASAEVALELRTSEERRTPVTGLLTHEPRIALGRAVARPGGLRRVLGVRLAGMTACPCAQENVAARARERLADAGFPEAEIEQVLDLVPVATHNQRGLATLLVGAGDDEAAGVDADALAALAREAMSAEVFELLKREDEAEVVERAHARPRFVEDCVREMLAGVVRALPGLDDGAIVSARQENLETIHRHDVVAERVALLGELRRELAGGTAAGAPVSVESWLGGA